MAAGAGDFLLVFSPSVAGSIHCYGWTSNGSSVVRKGCPITAISWKMKPSGAAAQLSAVRLSKKRRRQTRVFKKSTSKKQAVKTIEAPYTKQVKNNFSRRQNRLHYDDERLYICEKLKGKGRRSIFYNEVNKGDNCVIV